MEQFELFPDVPSANKASQSSIMSALVKTVRLRRVDDALYWFSHFAKFFPSQRFRLSRRLLIIAAEDNVCVPVQMRVAEWFPSAFGKDMKAWYQGAAVLIHLICATDNWWKTAIESHYILCWRRVTRQLAKMSEFDRKLLASEPMNFLDPAKSLLIHSARNDTNTWAPQKDKQDYARFLAEVAMERCDLPARMNALIHVHWGKILTGDDNYLGQAVYRMAYGPLTPIEYPTIKPEDVAASVSRVRERLRTPEIPPAWTQDGIHTGGTDRRFAGMLASMTACCRAYRVFGRLHPDDVHLPEFHSTTALFNLVAKENPTITMKGMP